MAKLKSIKEYSLKVSPVSYEGCEAAHGDLEQGVGDVGGVAVGEVVQHHHQARHDHAERAAHPRQLRRGPRLLRNLAPAPVHHRLAVNLVRVQTLHTTTLRMSTRMLLSHITRTCKIFTIILGSDSVTTKAYSEDGVLHLEGSLIARGRLLKVEGGKVDLGEPHVAEPGLRPPLEDLLRVLQREVVLEVVHAAARALAQHLAVVLVQLEGVAEVEECLGVSAANRLISEVVQSRRRPLLGPSPG